MAADTLAVFAAPVVAGRCSQGALRDVPAIGDVRASQRSLQAGSLPVRRVGDPILESNRARRVDFALFIVDALTSDEIIHRAPAIVGRQTVSALAHAATGRRVDGGAGVAAQ